MNFNLNNKYNALSSSKYVVALSIPVIKSKNVKIDLKMIVIHHFD